MFTSATRATTRFLFLRDKRNKRNIINTMGRAFALPLFYILTISGFLFRNTV